MLEHFFAAKLNHLALDKGGKNKKIEWQPGSIRASALYQNGVSKKKDGVNMPLLVKPASRYVGWMKHAQPISLSTTAWVALGVASFAAASGIGFAAWLDKDAGIFMSLVEAGMSWCF